MIQQPGGDKKLKRMKNASESANYQDKAVFMISQRVERCGIKRDEKGRREGKEKTWLTTDEGHRN